MHFVNVGTVVGIDVEGHGREVHFAVAGAAAASGSALNDGFFLLLARFRQYWCLHILFVDGPLRRDVLHRRRSFGQVRTWA